VPEFEVRPVGSVESPIADLDAAPPQGDEDAPAATVVLSPDFLSAARGLEVGDDVVIVTWLDRGDRTVLEVHPRGDPDRPLHGVFATRSPDRPNPIGLHEARIVAIDGARLTVDGMEAIDGTPVLDIKPVLGPRGSR
jgi:tRNA-Thr(GGU) m(6)t(6)A37 methyltransferase TsaA